MAHGYREGSITLKRLWDYSSAERQISKTAASKRKKMASRQRPEKQDKMEPRRMQADPNNIWVPPLFHAFVDRICSQEIAAMSHPNRRQPNEREKTEMRQAAEFNINAYAVPAGNA